MDNSYNAIVNCIATHKKSYTEITADGVQEKIISGDSAQITLPLGNNRIKIFTKRYGFTLIKTKDIYYRDLCVEPGIIYKIDVRIGQTTNRIEISQSAPSQ